MTQEAGGALYGPFIHVRHDKNIITLSYGDRGHLTYRCDNDGQLTKWMRERSDPRLEPKLVEPKPTDEHVQQRIEQRWHNIVPEMFYAEGVWKERIVRGLVLERCEVKVRGEERRLWFMASASPTNHKSVPPSCLVEDAKEVEPTESEEQVIQGVMDYWDQEGNKFK